MASRKPGFMRNREPNVHKEDKHRAPSRSAQRRRPRAPDAASLPDDVWDVFRLDEVDHLRDEPEPGDFWWEPEGTEP
jgi:hypothetical protein